MTLHCIMSVHEIAYFVAYIREVVNTSVIYVELNSQRRNNTHELFLKGHFPGTPCRVKADQEI